MIAAECLNCGAVTSHVKHEDAISWGVTHHKECLEVSPGQQRGEFELIELGEAG